MTHRDHLRSALLNAWESVVDGPYRRQEINSERGLQVHLCTALLRSLADKPRRLFVEPRIHVQGRSGFVFPDLLICSQRAVIGVVELKYTPRAQPSLERDLAKLRAFAEPEEVIEVSNERFLGKKLSLVKYALAKDALLCWAGIYTGQKLEVVPESPSKLRGRMLALHAITKQGSHPKIEVTGALAVLPNLSVKGTGLRPAPYVGR